MADAPDSQDALASFMSITGANSDSALQFLELTNWKLDEAVNLFMESGTQSSSTAFTASHPSVASQNTSFDSVPTMPMDIDAATAAAIAAAYGEDDNAVRAPDPSKRQRLVDSDTVRSMRHLRDHNRDFAAESIAAMTASSISTAFGSLGAVDPSSRLNDADGAGSERTQDLNTLFQPPTNIMFPGTYADARTNAKNEGKWLLVNIQDKLVFASHRLNRDTWSDDVVQNLVASGFVFWQNYWTSEYGKKFCNLYQIERESLPIVIIIDPRTGELRQRWTGFYEPQDMTEKLSDFCCMHTIDTPMTGQEVVKTDLMDASEDDQLAAAIAASMQDNDISGEAEQSEDVMEQEEMAEDVALAPEPDAGAPDVTRIQVRMPDGSRLTRRFLRTDLLAMVWTFVKDQVPEARLRAFELRTAFPPSVVVYNDTVSFEEGKLENASLMVKWL